MPPNEMVWVSSEAKFWEDFRSEVTTGYPFALSIRSICLVLTFNLIDSYTPGLPGPWDIPQGYGIGMTWSGMVYQWSAGTVDCVCSWDGLESGLRPCVPWSVTWYQGSSESIKCLIIVSKAVFIIYVLYSQNSWLHLVYNIFGFIVS